MWWNSKFDNLERKIELLEHKINELTSLDKDTPRPAGELGQIYNCKPEVFHRLRRKGVLEGIPWGKEVRYTIRQVETYMKNNKTKGVIR